MSHETIDKILAESKRRKELKVYYLMAQNAIVLSITQTGFVTMYDSGLVPFDLYVEVCESYDFECTRNNLLNFEAWCASRVLTLDRMYAKEILNALALKQATTDKDRCQIALLCKCVSLQDFYWVTEDNSLSWSAINLFDNSLGDIVDVALKGKVKTITSIDIASKDISTAGIAPKAWARKNNDFYLYKGNGTGSPVNEVKASKALRELGFNVVNYSLVDNKYSKCKCFTTKDIGYVTAGNFNMNYDLKPLLENEGFKKSFWEMILADFLIGNSDRHQDNWFIMFDKKRNITGLSPLLDFDHAFKAPVDFMCLPLQLFGEYNTMITSAIRAVNILHIDIDDLVSKSSDSYVTGRLRYLKEFT